MNRSYNTPFIGLAIPPDDYIKIISNLDEYLSVELTINDFIKLDNYPVAILSGVKINFIHYENEKDAIDKWNRRRLRLLSFIKENGIESIIFKFCYVDHPKEELINRFNELNLKRKIFLEKTSIINKRNGNFLDGLELYQVRFLYYREFLKLFRGL